MTVAEVGGETGFIGVIGIIGVGEIAEAMIRGLLTPGASVNNAIILSPRGSARTAALAAEFPQVTVAQSNAQVVSQADTVIVSVRPDQLDEALDGVGFRSDQVLISTLAGISVDTLKAACEPGAVPAVVRAVPLPPVSRRAGITPLLPAEPRACAIFDLLGGYLAVEDEDQMATVTVITGAQTGLLQYISVLSQWAAAHGLEAASTEMFIRHTVAGFEPGLRDASMTLDKLIDDFETPGGLNWQLRTGFFNDATTSALDRELDALHSRVQEQ